MFFEYDLTFRCIVVDKRKVNDEVFNDGDKELGFYKFYYHLILNMFAKDNLESNTKYAPLLQAFLAKYEIKNCYIIHLCIKLL